MCLLELPISRTGMCTGVRLADAWTLVTLRSVKAWVFRDWCPPSAMPQILNSQSRTATRGKGRVRLKLALLL